MMTKLLFFCEKEEGQVGNDYDSYNVMYHSLQQLSKYTEQCAKARSKISQNHSDKIYHYQQPMSMIPLSRRPSKPAHRGAFCQFPFRSIYYYDSNKFTGKEIEKMHLCAAYYIKD